MEFPFTEQRTADGVRRAAVAVRRLKCALSALDGQRGRAIVLKSHVLVRHAPSEIGRFIDHLLIKEATNPPRMSAEHAQTAANALGQAHVDAVPVITQEMLAERDALRASRRPGLGGLTFGEWYDKVLAAHAGSETAVPSFNWRDGVNAGAIPDAELSMAIDALNSGRAPDGNGVLTDLISNTPIVRAWIAPLVQGVLSSPQDLHGGGKCAVKCSIATAISKSLGEPPTVGNARLIVSMSWLLRIVSNIALHRLTRDIGDARRHRSIEAAVAPSTLLGVTIDRSPQCAGVSVEQGGFKAARSSSQVACAVYEGLRMRSLQGLPTIIVSADASKAFDRVPICTELGLLDRLVLMGAKSSTIACLLPVLTDRSMRVKVLGHLSREFQLDLGVPQGCSVSPAAYTRFCDVVSTALNSLVDDDGQLLGGVKLGTHRTAGAAFADDTLLMASNVANMQIMLDVYADICRHDFLKINPKKTVAMMIGLDTPDRLQIGGHDLEYVDHVKYLGVHLAKDLSWDLHLLSQARKASSIVRSCTSRLANTDLPLHVQISQCKARVWSVLEYGMESAASMLTVSQRQATQQVYLRSVRALVRAGSRGRGIQNAWLLQSLGLPSPNTRIAYISLQMYTRLLFLCLRSSAPDALSWLLSSQHGIVWLETLRVMICGPRSGVTRPDTLRAVRDHQALVDVGWAPAAGPSDQARYRTRQATRERVLGCCSTWVGDFLSADELDEIREFGLTPRRPNQEDMHDPLFRAMVRVLPLAAVSLTMIMGCLLMRKVDVTADSTAKGFLKLVQAAINQRDYSISRLRALSILEDAMGMWPSSVHGEDDAPNSLLALARAYGALGRGLPYAEVHRPLLTPGSLVPSECHRRAMWVNFAVLMPLSAGCLDLHATRMDRGGWIYRRLRNGFDWHVSEYDVCPFCGLQSPFLVQHWASGVGCTNPRVKRLRALLWEGLARLVQHPWVQTLVASACGQSAVLPPPEDIAWEPACSLPMRLLLGGHIYPTEAGPLRQSSTGRSTCMGVTPEPACAPPRNEGWLPGHIVAVARIAAKSPLALQRLVLALQCNTDRLLVEHHCRLWLRCVHDVRKKNNSPAMLHRRAQLAVASDPGSVSNAVRARVLKHSGRCFAALKQKFGLVNSLQHI